MIWHTDSHEMLSVSAHTVLNLHYAFTQVILLLQ